MVGPRSSFFKVIRGKSLIIFGSVMGGVSAVGIVYLFMNFNALSWRVGANTSADYVFGFILLIPILLMAWKRGGGSLIILILIPPRHVSWWKKEYE